MTDPRAQYGSQALDAIRAALAAPSVAPLQPLHEGVGGWIEEARKWARVYRKCAEDGKRSGAESVPYWEATADSFDRIVAWADAGAPPPLAAAPLQEPAAIGHASFEVREDEETGRRFWYGAEEGWKGGTEAGRDGDGALVMLPEHFAVGTRITMEEPLSAEEECPS